MADRRVTIDYDVDDSELKKSEATVDKALNPKKFSTFAVGMAASGAAMSAFGTGMALGVSAPIVAATSALANMAFAEEEAASLARVSFGDMIDAGEEWASRLSKTLGLNYYEIKRQAAIQYTMLEAMGLTKKEAFDTSTAMVEMAADFSSFYDMPHARALEIISAALRGEMEPLKQIGIVVDEASRNEYAYANAIAERGKQLNFTQKMQATFGVIQQRTATAQGDLLRTYDSATNSLRRFKNQFIQGLTAMGVAMAPAFESIVQFIGRIQAAVTDAMAAFAKMPPGVHAATLTVLGLTAALGPLLIAFGSLLLGIAAMSLGWERLNVRVAANTIATGINTAAQKIQGVAVGAVMLPVRALGVAYTTLMARGTVAAATLSGAFSKAGISSALATVSGSVTALTTRLKLLSASALTAAGSLRTMSVSGALSASMATASGAVAGLGRGLGGLVVRLGGLLNPLHLLRAGWAVLLVPIKLVLGVLAGVAGVVLSVKGAIAIAVLAIGALAASFASGVAKTREFGTLFKVIGEFLGVTWRAAVEGARLVLGKMFDLVKSGITWVRDLGAGMGEMVPDWLKTAIGVVAAKIEDATTKIRQWTSDQERARVVSEGMAEALEDWGDVTPTLDQITEKFHTLEAGIAAATDDAEIEAMSEALEKVRGDALEQLVVGAANLGEHVELIGKVSVPMLTEGLGILERKSASAGEAIQDMGRNAEILDEELARMEREDPGAFIGIKHRVEELRAELQKVSREGQEVDLAGPYEVFNAASAESLERVTEFLGVAGNKERFAGLANVIGGLKTSIEGVKGEATMSVEAYRRLEEQINELVAAGHPLNEEMKDFIENMGEAAKAAEAEAEAVKAAAEAEKKAAEAAAQYAKSVDKMRASLVGAVGDIGPLRDAWAGLSDAQRAHEPTQERLIAQYLKLRAEITDPSKLPADLEAVMMANEGWAETVVKLRKEGQLLTEQQQEYLLTLDEAAGAFGDLRKKGEELSAAEERVFLAGEDVVETLKGMFTASVELTEAERERLETSKDAGKFFLEQLMQGRDLTEQQFALAAAYGDAQRAQQGVITVSAEAVRQSDEAMAGTLRFGDALETANGRAEPWKQTLKDLTADLANMESHGLEIADQGMFDLATTIDEAGIPLDALPPKLQEIYLHAKKLGHTLDDSAGKAVDWSGAFQRAFERGGDAFGGFASGIMEKLTGTGGVFKSMLDGVAGVAGPMGGILSGALTGGISTAVTVGLKLLGKLGGKIKEWFGGPDELEREGRASAESWLSGMSQGLTSAQEMEALNAGWADLDLARSWIGFREQAIAAGMDIKTAEGYWNRMQSAIAQGPEAVARVRREWEMTTQAGREAVQQAEEYERVAAEGAKMFEDSMAWLTDTGTETKTPFDGWLESVQGLSPEIDGLAQGFRQMAIQAGHVVVDTQAMEEAAGAWGLEMKDLGDVYQGATLKEDLKEISGQFMHLMESGLSAQQVIAKITVDEDNEMLGKIQNLVTKSLEMGQAIPESMRPLIEGLIEGGHLTDALGNKLTDASEVEFGAAMTPEMNIMMEGFSAIIEALGGEIPEAFKKMAESGAEAMAGTAESAREAAGLTVAEWENLTDEQRKQLEIQQQQSQLAHDEMSGGVRESLEAQLGDYKTQADEKLKILDAEKVQVQAVHDETVRLSKEATDAKIADMASQKENYERVNGEMTGDVKEAWDERLRHINLAHEEIVNQAKSERDEKLGVLDQETLDVKDAYKDQVEAAELTARDKILELEAQIEKSRLAHEDMAQQSKDLSKVQLDEFDSVEKGAKIHYDNVSGQWLITCQGMTTTTQTAVNGEGGINGWLAAIKSEDVHIDFVERRAAENNRVVPAGTLGTWISDELGDIDDETVNIRFVERRNPPMHAEELAKRVNEALDTIRPKTVDVHLRGMGLLDGDPHLDHLRHDLEQVGGLQGETVEVRAVAAGELDRLPEAQVPPAGLAALDPGGRDARHPNLFQPRAPTADELGAAVARALQRNPPRIVVDDRLGAAVGRSLYMTSRTRIGNSV